MTEESANGTSVHFRRYAREIVLQYLFQCDIIGFDNIEKKEDSFSVLFRENEIFNLPEKKLVKIVYKACVKILNGIFENITNIDEILSKYSKKSKWTLGRMSAVDRNVMRIAIYEMLYCNNVPPIVSINEAVEIGKKYGSEHSPVFINGILNGVKEHLSRPLR